MRFAFITLLILLNSACGKVQAQSTPSVEQIQAPNGWGHQLSCFIVRDENGKAVGGNCLPR